jgi:hypothetical protein
MSWYLTLSYELYAVLAYTTWQVNVQNRHIDQLSGCLDYDKCYLPTWKKTEDCTTYRCRGKTRSFTVFKTGNYRVLCQSCDYCVSRITIMPGVLLYYYVRHMTIVTAVWALCQLYDYCDSCMSIVSAVWLLCQLHDYIVSDVWQYCVRCMTIVSAIWLLCQLYENCVNHMTIVLAIWLLTFVLAIWLLCQPYDYCISRMTIVLAIWLLCHPYDYCVSCMKIVSTVWLLC